MLRKRLIINSNIDRDFLGEHSDFRVYMDQSIEAGQDKLMIALKKVSIPNTVYTFHVQDSYLWYVYDGTLHNIKLPTNEVITDGSNLAQAITDLFSVNNHDIEANMNTESNRLQFTNNSNVDVRIVSSDLYEPVVNNTEIVNSANNKLGLIEDLSNNVIQPSFTYEAVGVPKIISSSVFHITSKAIGDYRQSILPKQQELQQYIIYTLLNNAGFGDINNDNIPHDDMKWLEVDGMIDSIDIQVRDENYRIVDLNGGNIILEFELYKTG
jgi:hypothetical protein